MKNLFLAKMHAAKGGNKGAVSPADGNHPVDY